MLVNDIEIRIPSLQSVSKTSMCSISCFDQRRAPTEPVLIGFWSAHERRSGYKLYLWYCGSVQGERDFRKTLYHWNVDVPTFLRYKVWLCACRTASFRAFCVILIPAYCIKTETMLKRCGEIWDTQQRPSRWMSMACFGTYERGQCKPDEAAYWGTSLAFALAPKDC